MGDGVGGVGVPCGRRANGEHFSSRSGPPTLAMNSSGCVESCQMVSLPTSECATGVEVVATLHGRIVIYSGKRDAKWKRLDLT